MQRANRNSVMKRVEMFTRVYIKAFGRWEAYNVEGGLEMFDCFVINPNTIARLDAA